MEERFTKNPELVVQSRAERIMVRVLSKVERKDREK
jgi:hypothetical protein